MSLAVTARRRSPQQKVAAKAPPFCMGSQCTGRCSKKYA
ncbi:Uncharacterised protein [Mycobacteroides abscessus subsp. abscessus]|nr:Uncharacterised protein [Mycobacteroides abscessus subsp. abscessus]